MTYPQMDPRRLDLTGTFGLRVANADAAEVRIGTAGRWGQRVNLATNPSFEATSGTVVVRTNLATSPRSYTPAASGPHPGLGAGPYTGSAEIDGVRQEVDPLALVGGTTYVHLLIESGTVPLGDYFDGDESPDPDLTPEWTGAANGSTSVLRGAAVARVGDIQIYSASTIAAVSSALVMSSGARCLRLIRKAPGDAFAASSVADGFKAGRTYRVSTTVYAPAGIGGHISIQYRGGTYPAVILLPGGSTIPASERRTWIAAIPDDPSVWANPARTGLVLRASLVVGESVWYDNLLVEDVTDLAAQWAALPDPKPTLDAWLDERLSSDHFDGDTPDTPAALHHWTATPHASTSVRTLAWQPGD